MVANDPHNRKQPFVLGMIALISGILLAFFVIEFVKASEYHDNYNYVAFIEIQNSYVNFTDNEGNVIYSLPSFHGADIPNTEFENALNNLLSFVPASQCIVYYTDNLATLSVYEYVYEALTSRYVTLVVLPKNNFPIDISGYVLENYPAGYWSVPIYTKSELISPTPSPTATPTPDPNMQEYHILLNHVNGVYNKTSYMVSFKASGILNEYNQPLNSTVESVLLDSGTESTNLKYNACIMKTGSYGGSWLGNYYGTGYLFYIKCSSFNDLKLYKNSNAFASESFEYIENNYSYTFVKEGSLQNEGNGYDVFYYVSEVDDGYILAFSFKTGEYAPVSEFNKSSDIWFQVSDINSTNLTNYFVPFNDNSDQYKLALRLMLDVENNAIPDPNVTPAPPTPTEAPHVIINWPSGTPSPTPPFSVSGDIGPGSGSSSTGSLSPGQVGSTLNTFKQYTENNGAFAFLYACTSVIPDEALYFLFILLFVLLLIAVIRLFVHYGG